jgi:hypothetical protein
MAIEEVAVGSMRQDPHRGCPSALKDTGAVKSDHLSSDFRDAAVVRAAT